jgi:uncharacterized protein YeaO (DUF488 family)
VGGVSDDAPPPEPARKARPARAKGPEGRARLLLDGLVTRLVRRGLSARREEGGVLFVREGAVVARAEPAAGYVLVDLDPRAGAGSERGLRNLGVPHPDRERSARGWRRMEVRTHRDGDVVVSTLRAPRDKASGEETAVVTTRTRAPGGSVAVRTAAAPPRPEDGTRVLVDASWPKALERDVGAVAEWMPRVAPSTPLRSAYGVAPGRHRGFRRRYLAELRGSAKAEDVSRLRALARKGRLTLVTGVREVEASAAWVLADAVSRAHTPHA